MRVLVSGATGFLGQHVVLALVGKGHEVRAIARPAARVPAWGREVDIFRADLRAGGDLSKAFEHIDAVLHLAAATTGGEDDQFVSTVIGTERFLNAMAKSPARRLVLVSSLVVYDWARAKTTIDEATPLIDRPYDLGAYTIAKVWQERVATELARVEGLQMTIVRPGFIWGRGHAEVAGMGRRFGRIQLMIGPMTRLPLTHVQNCADALVAAVEQPESIGKNFNIVDSDDIRVWRYSWEHARRSCQFTVLVPVPYLVGLGLARLAAAISRFFFGPSGKLPSLLTPRKYQWQFKPLRFSNAKLSRTLSWRPPLGFEEALNRTYEPRKA